MQFKVKSTFDTVIKHWPKEINVENFEGNQRVFPALSTAWNEVEKVIGSDNPWAELMVWVIFCVLHEKALENSRKQKIRFIYPNDIPFSLFSNKYKKQLDSDEWADLKKEFEN